MASAPQRMEQSELENIFNSLKPKQTISVWFDSAIKSADSWTELQVGRRSKSKKYNLEKISLIHPTNPKGRKDFLYNRQGRISFAIGDMATRLIAIKTHGKNAESFGAEEVCSECDVEDSDSVRKCPDCMDSFCLDHMRMCEVDGCIDLYVPKCESCFENHPCLGREAESFAADNYLQEQVNCNYCGSDNIRHIKGYKCMNCANEVYYHAESFSAEHNQTRFYRNLGVGVALVAGLAYWFKK